jgi:hypothetical protein
MASWVWIMIGVAIVAAVGVLIAVATSVEWESRADRLAAQAREEMQRAEKLAERAEQLVTNVRVRQRDKARRESHLPPRRQIRRTLNSQC